MQFSNQNIYNNTLSIEPNKVIVEDGIDKVNKGKLLDGVETEFKGLVGINNVNQKLDNPMSKDTIENFSKKYSIASLREVCERLDNKNKEKALDLIERAKKDSRSELNTEEFIKCYKKGMMIYNEEYYTSLNFDDSKEFIKILISD